MAASASGSSPAVVPSGTDRLANAGFTGLAWYGRLAVLGIVLGCLAMLIVGIYTLVADPTVTTTTTDGSVTEVDSKTLGGVLTGVGAVLLVVFTFIGYKVWTDKDNAAAFGTFRFLAR